MFTWCSNTKVFLDIGNILIEPTDLKLSIDRRESWLADRVTSLGEAEQLVLRHSEDDDGARLWTDDQGRRPWFGLGGAARLGRRERR